MKLRWNNGAMLVIVLLCCQVTLVVSFLNPPTLLSSSIVVGVGIGGGGGGSGSASASRHRRHPVHVATSLVLGSDEQGGSYSQPLQNVNLEPNSPRLSRPERKALERATTNNNNSVNKKRPKVYNRPNTNHRKHNFDDRKKELLQTRRPDEGPYDLHSTAVSSLNPASSPSDVMRAIKRAQNLHDVHDLGAIERFLLERTDDTFAYGFRGSLLARLAVAALHMNNHELARRAMEERRNKHRSSMLPLESAAIIRGLLRVHNVTDAFHVLHDELSPPLPGTIQSDVGNKDRVKHRALSLASIASRHFFEGEPSRALIACQLLAAMERSVQEAELTAEELTMPWLRLVQAAARCESGRRNGSIRPCVGVDVELPCNLVFAVLDAMATFPTVNDDDLYEAISNALVRRVAFVTGAVAMDKCPAANRGEAAFIGRSNVGKSSLINMVTNRKSLAFTSKEPGKTQQFNFFAVNEKAATTATTRSPSKKSGSSIVDDDYDDDDDDFRDPDSFYLVDLPGYGFAKVSPQQREQWAVLMADYIANRDSLRVLFHLIDARHGPTEDDRTIMRQVGGVVVRPTKSNNNSNNKNLRHDDNNDNKVTYVIVLTKADKNVKGAASSKNSGRVAPSVLQKLQTSMADCGVGQAPIVITSAETKLGRDEMWRFLRRAAEPLAAAAATAGSSLGTQ